MDYPDLNRGRKWSNVIQIEDAKHTLTLKETITQILKNRALQTPLKWPESLAAFCPSLSSE